MHLFARIRGSGQTVNVKGISKGPATRKGRSENHPQNSNQSQEARTELERKNYFLDEGKPAAGEKRRGGVGGHKVIS